VRSLSFHEQPCMQGWGVSACFLLECYIPFYSTTTIGTQAQATERKTIKNGDCHMYHEYIPEVSGLTAKMCNIEQLQRLPRMKATGCPPATHHHVIATHDSQHIHKKAEHQTSYACCGSSAMNTGASQSSGLHNPSIRGLVRSSCLSLQLRIQRCIVNRSQQIHRTG
jgi:hypothetical protein